MGTASLSRDQSGRGVALTTHPPTSSAEVKEIVELYPTALLSLHGLLSDKFHCYDKDRDTGKREREGKIAIFFYDIFNCNWVANRWQ